VADASPEAGNRCVCYCDDCQSFAHFLGRADEILDPHGGTDIFQMSSARLSFSAGIEDLACMRLTGSGMLRWYARCCMTPIGNTPSTNRVPFVGLIHRCIAGFASDGRGPDDVLGPIRMRGFGRYAKGDRSRLDAHETAPEAMGVRVTELIQQALARGEQDRNPFFEATDTPIRTPHVLTTSELERAETARDKV
jgi:hypothetical protein